MDQPSKTHDVSVHHCDKLEAALGGTIIVSNSASDVPSIHIPHHPILLRIVAQMLLPLSSCGQFSSHPQLPASKFCKFRKQLLRSVIFFFFLGQALLRYNKQDPDSHRVNQPLEVILDLRGRSGEVQMTGCPLCSLGPSYLNNLRRLSATKSLGSGMDINTFDISAPIKLVTFNFFKDPSSTESTPKRPLRKASKYLLHKFILHRK